MLILEPLRLLKPALMFIRKNCVMMVIAIILCICISPTYAKEMSTAYSPQQLGVIREAQIRISENRDALNEGEISRNACEGRIARIMARLNADFPIILTEATLMEMNLSNVVPRMTTAERKESFFVGVDFLRLGLIAVFTILTMLLIGKHLIKVLIHFPKELWEISAYTSGLSILVAQGVGYMTINQFWALFGCLLIGGGLALTNIIHSHYFEDKPRSKKRYIQYVCPAVMLAVFSAATLITGSDWVGALAALSLMSLLGFAGEVIPFGYVIGFKDTDALARGTSAGFIIMTFFMGLHAGNITSGYIRAFETGSLIVGGFVGYLGLLIAGSIWYKRSQRWIVMQIIVITICFAGVISGSIIGLKSVQIMASVFLTLWTIEKIVEIPGNGFVPWVLKLMAASGTVYLIVTYGAPIYARYLIE